MVFQNYALFPHMTVAREHRLSAVGARNRRRARSHKRVERALDMVQLPSLGARRPAQLSGGQQQRVAVARALVFEPKLVLMDEPLGALDKQLREQMQLEMRRLHQRLGVTMIYVTHDQHEALTMSDRIAVFHRGRDPATRSSGAHLRAAVERVRCALHRREQPPRRPARRRRRQPLHDPLAGDALVEGSLAAPLPAGAQVMVSLRPERVQIGGAAPTIGANGHCRLAGRLREVIYLGDHVRARVALPGNDDFTVKRPIDDAHRLPAIGQPVELAWAPEHCRAFAREDADIPT